jgi:peptide deformylase
MHLFLQPMILPIVAYGAPILRKVCEDITPIIPNLGKLLEDMWETMYSSSGVGLAAPQINKDIRLFIVDSQQIFANREDDEEDKYSDAPGIKQVFINAHIKSLAGEEWAYNEGCLSIPKIREDVLRPEEVTLSFMDENFLPQTATFHGISARIILHEYDHIEGKLIHRLSQAIETQADEGKLDDISKGKIKVDYKMSFNR